MKNFRNSLKTGPVVHIAPALPLAPSSFPLEDHLEINILYTNFPGSCTALRQVPILTKGLETKLRLIVLQVVPYPIPLNDAHDAPVFMEQTVRSLVSNWPSEIRVEIFLCRDWRKDLLRVLKPHSLVVVGTQGLWWRWKTKRLARLLRENGHQMVAFSSRN